jgi:hypothetical protein
MKNIPDALKPKFESWTQGLTIVTIIQPDPLSIVVVGKRIKGDGAKARDFYDVLGFFTLAAKWEVSCDLRDGTADQAFAELSRRLSTRQFQIEPDTADSETM